MLISGRMAFNYTKTALIMVAAQFAIRLPLTYIVDAKPFVTGGVFWAGVAMFVFMVPIGLAADLVSWAWRRGYPSASARQGRSLRR